MDTLAGEIERRVLVEDIVGIAMGENVCSRSCTTGTFATGYAAAIALNDLPAIMKHDSMRRCAMSWRSLRPSLRFATLEFAMTFLTKVLRMWSWTMKDEGLKE